MSFNADTDLGALLVGTWILYAVEVTQAVYYYHHFKHDNWMLKLLVPSTIAIDSVSMIANYASVYLPTITHWGDLAFLQNQYWPYPLYVLTTGTVAALVQGFLVVRYWLLAKNKFITLTLFVFITVAIGGAFTTAVTIAIFPAYDDRSKIVIPATIWLFTEALTDISIALALLLQFRKVKSSFKETRSLLNRLVAQTIQTGATGATVALAALIAFLTNNENNVCSGIAYCIGRVYCITMLVNLNRRRTGSMGSSKAMSSGANPETRGEREIQERSEGGDEYGGIHVHRTAMVHIETPQEFSRGSFKPNSGQGGLPDRPAVAIEMTVHDSDFYPSKKPDLFNA